MTNPVLDAVAQRVEDVRRAQETVDLGRRAQAILEDPLIAGWFKSQSESAVNQLLTAPDHDLPRLRAYTVALKQLYEHLADTLKRGQAAANRLAQQGDNDGH